LEHILDNPIYQALATGNRHLAGGNDQAKYFPEEVSPLAGLQTNSPDDFDALYRVSPETRTFILFTLNPVSIPARWKGPLLMDILQMIYEGPDTAGETETEPVALQEKHMPEMLALTKMTNPGPFLSGTIRFGNYRGIFDGTRLVAMAGQRLQPLPYIEISAVCTHPDHHGKGYASLLIRDQVRRIRSASGIPFLHVRRDNATAVRLYEKLGFKARAKLLVYAVRKRGT
jgi:ribosomal protein S18 acetylase RimI-like enzyme